MTRATEIIAADPVVRTPTLTPWSTARPARVGWYVASYDDTLDDRMRRYWSGTEWSAPCWHDDPQGHFDRARATPGECQTGIVWRGVDVTFMTDEELEAFIEAHKHAPTPAGDVIAPFLCLLVVNDLYEVYVDKLKANGLFATA